MKNDLFQNGEVRFPEDEEDAGEVDEDPDEIHVNLPTPPPIVKFEL